jgi:rubrerythrin
MTKRAEVDLLTVYFEGKTRKHDNQVFFWDTVRWLITLGYTITCRRCGATFSDRLEPYCPNCGPKIPEHKLLF